MKKILCISPHFPPVNAADMHRLRLALPYFEANGWQATILTVEPEYVKLSKDDMLIKGLSNYAEIVRVKALSQNWTGKIGLGNLGIRALPYLLKAGNRLIKSQSFELVYFSTTVFDCMTLGRYWFDKFGVPFVIDLQDPWRNDFHLANDASRRPAKYWFDHRLKTATERWTVPSASGITAVTQQYINVIKERYPVTHDIPTLELTFGADERDFGVLESGNISNPIFDKHRDTVNIVYTGVVPESMAFTLEVFFYALRLDEEMANKVKIHFVGTDYATDTRAKERVIPYALKYGVEQFATEHVVRLPYFQALQVMKDADILLLPGTTDSHYTASKLYPYILSRKPVLAIFSEKSNASEILRRLESPELITFSDRDSVENIGEKVAFSLREMLLNIPFKPKTNWQQFEEYTASTMTKKLTTFFDRVLVYVAPDNS